VTSPAGVARRGRARSWVAAIGVLDPADRTPSLPERRTVLAGAAGGPGLELLAASVDDLPGAASDARAAVVFEGRLDARDELARELGSSATLGDAELVLAAYHRWGRRFPARLRGAWAIVLLDGRTGGILATRDRLGIYPLHHTRAGGATLFATSPALLLAHPRADATLHRAVLAEILCYRFLDVRETAWAAVRRVPPAHLWERPADAATGDERIERYWDPGTAGALAGPPEELTARFDELLDRAVGRCLEEGPAAIFLSGGLDSVSLAAVAAAQSEATGAPPPFALSLVFPDTEAHEAPVQRAVAEGLGLPQILLGFEEASGAGNPLIAAARTSRSFPAPVLTPWRAAYLRLGEEIRRQGRAGVITGHGGDEWLGVSIYLAADYIRRGDLAGLRRLWRTRRRSFRLTAARSAYYVLWLYGLRPVLAAAAVRALGRAAPRVVRVRKRRHLERTTPAWVAPDPDLRAELLRRGEELLPDPPRGDFYQRANLDSIAHVQSTWEIEEIFESARICGAPLFAPFLDSELVEFLYRVPPELLSAGERTKGLVRNALSRRFPDLGFERQLKVAATPYFRSLVAEQGPAALAEAGGLPTLSEVGLVAPGAGSAIIRAIADRPRHETARLWFALSVEQWVQSH
jgi:asparagine synthase (glutamine-hydrolysing)